MTTSLTRGGLIAAEASQLLSEHGSNRVPAPAGLSVRQRLIRQLTDPLIIVLLVAVALTLATGDHADAIIIALVITLNTAVGLTQEIRADQAIAALRNLTAPEVRVIRDGAVTTVDAELLVPGDLVLMGEGDVIPADARLVMAAALLVDESTLTGESVPVEKTPDASAGAELSAGTVVVHGRAEAVVTRTGADSALGKIAAALTAPSSLTPLQRRLAGLGRVLALVAGGLCVVVMSIGLARGEPAELMVVTAISLAVAAVPESLPAVVTLSLALGARRMAARHAIVRRLAAVETLGSVTVLATDKTGTLTEGAMVAELLWAPRRTVTLTGGGYDPAGELSDEAGELDVAKAADVDRLLRACVLCNDADLLPPDSAGDRWRPLGDPTEAALVAAAAKFGLDADDVRTAFPRLAEVPFDSDRRRMTTIHENGDGLLLVACKGAPERVLTLEVLECPADLVAAARARADEYTDAGYRVLAVATGQRPGPVPTGGLARVEQGLTLCGLVALADPPRPTAGRTLDDCRAAGIIPVLISGDHLATASNIAARVGILKGSDRAITTADLAVEVPDPGDVGVFARTDPGQKLRLIEAWRRRGHVVAMQGDGVNDAPSLRQADIGVAMGGRGTEIARQAADIVLTDDNLETVVAAVEEGRRVYANIRRFLLYGLAGGAAEILIMLLGPAVGLALPLLPAQILWVNLITHGLPGVAMGAEPAEAAAMRRPPRPPAESVLGAGLWPRVLTLGVVITAVSIGVGLWGYANDRPWQSMVFFVLATMQLGVALGVRARPGTATNSTLLAAVGLSFGLQLAALYVPALRDLLGTHALTAAEVAVLCALSLIGYVAARAMRVNTTRRPTS